MVRVPAERQQPTPPRAGLVAAGRRSAGPAGACDLADRTGVRAGPSERAARNRADEKWNLRVPVKAGQREVIVTFLNRTSALEETTRLPFLRPYPAGVNIPETRLGVYLRSVEIAGPLRPTGAGNAPSRERIFSCTPGWRRPDAACARRILSDACAARISPSGDGRGRRAAAGVLSRG